MDHPRPFDEPEQIVEEGTPLPRMTRTGDEKVMNDTIGIDISKDHLDTHRLSDGKAKRFTNDRTGLKTLKNWIGPQCCRVVYEPTGRYHRDLEARLSKTAHAMVKVNPERARRFAEAVGQSAKTDRIDAELLARMGAMLDLKASPLRDEPMNDLREVHVARSALIKDQTACRNRLCGARNTLVKAQLKTRMRQIAKQLAQLDAELKKRICEDAKLARQFEILRSIPCRRNTHRNAGDRNLDAQAGRRACGPGSLRAQVRQMDSQSENRRRTSRASPGALHARPRRSALQFPTHLRLQGFASKGQESQGRSCGNHAQAHHPRKYLDPRKPPVVQNQTLTRTDILR